MPVDAPVPGIGTGEAKYVSDITQLRDAEAYTTLKIRLTVPKWGLLSRSCLRSKRPGEEAEDGHGDG